jgi:selenocysteine-specific translation elongation factor
LQRIASGIAKKGTESDLILYDKKERETALSIVIPKTYPERIQPLLYAMYMSDAAIFAPETADSIAGEMIVALSAFHKSGVVISGSDGMDRLTQILKSRGGNWLEIEENDAPGRLMEWIEGMELKRDENTEFWRVDVDHSFEVRGVGTVVLGIVRYGTVRVHDKVIASPTGKEGSVRSIQIFDVDYKEAPAGSRVGLALKGLDVEDVPRGTVITNNLRFQAAKTLRIMLRKESYFRDPLDSGGNIGINIGLQSKTARIISSDGEIELETETEIAFENEEATLFAAKPPGQLRIAGRGPAARLI